MGCCCCGGPLVGPDSCATLKKWNSSGILQWSRKRADLQGGGDPHDYALYLDTSVFYAAGTSAEGEDEGNLYKWTGLSGPSIAWESDRNGLTEGTLSGLTVPTYGARRIEFASDGYIWVSGNSGLNRYNSSGVQQNRIVVGSERLVPSTSGAMFTSSTGGSPLVLRRYDTSGTNTHSYNFGDATSGIVNDYATVSAGSTIVAVGGAVSNNKRIAVLDHTLAESATYTDAGITSVTRCVNSGNTMYTCEFNGGTFSQFGKYDLSGISQTWTNTTTQSTGTGYKPPATFRTAMALDSNGDWYIAVEKSGAFSKIQKRSPSDGSITWEADIGASKVAGISGIWVNYTAGLLVAIGRWYHGAASTNPKHIIVLDISDGSEVWSDVHGTVATSTDGFFDAAIDSSGNVYACGSCEAT